MRTLAIPPAAQRDENSIQMISGWIAEQGLHTTLNIGMWQDAGRNEPKSWGAFLADVVRHISNAIQDHTGAPAEEMAATILASLAKEFNNPTSNTSGTLQSGHS
jgi:hypothetical protein